MRDFDKQMEMVLYHSDEGELYTITDWLGLVPILLLKREKT